MVDLDRYLADPPARRFSSLESGAGAEQLHASLIYDCKHVRLLVPYLSSYLVNNLAGFELRLTC